MPWVFEYYHPKLENQMEKTIEKEMESAVVQGRIGRITHFIFSQQARITFCNAAARAEPGHKAQLEVHRTLNQHSRFS